MKQMGTWGGKQPPLMYINLKTVESPNRVFSSKCLLFLKCHLIYIDMCVCINIKKLAHWVSKVRKISKY